MRLPLLLAVLLVGCPTQPLPPEVAPPTIGVETLSVEQTLVRASVLLRGVRPSLDEFDAVAVDPAALEGIVETYLDSSEFGAAVRRWHGEWLLTDTWKDFYPAGFPSIGQLADLGNIDLNRQVQEGPGRLAEFVVRNDRSYSELVLADYTIANRTTSTVWGLLYEGDGGWSQAWFGDGRPAAGILVDPWVFTRFASTDTNLQRERASKLARSLLCHDYLSREVRVPADVDITEGGANSLTENAVCVSCHSTLDELGAFFGPHVSIIYPEATWEYPVQSWAGVAQPGLPTPSFYGTPGPGLRSLGEMIAEDPRFARCSVRRFYGQLMGIDEPEIPDEVEDRYVGDFMDSGLLVKRLLKRMVLSDEFAALGSDDPNLEHVSGLRRIKPWHMSRMLRDLAGMEWETDLDEDWGLGRLGETPLIDDVTWGFRDLAGGSDGFFRFEQKRTANPTTLLVLRGVAAQAALRIAANLGEGLLTVSADADEAAVRQQLVDLHLRLYGERWATDDAAIDAGWTLFEAGGGAGDAENAWTVVLFALLQDPRILYV